MRISYSSNWLWHVIHQTIIFDDIVKYHLANEAAWGFLLLIKQIPLQQFSPWLQIVASYDVLNLIVVS